MGCMETSLVLEERGSQKPEGSIVVAVIWDEKERKGKLGCCVGREGGEYGL